MFENTPCSEEKQYGYNTANPCVLVKLNKMIDYVPLTNGSGKVEIRCYQDVCGFRIYFFAVKLIRK